MATLEKIRSKSVFLFIIIIVALLAFILGDFLTSGRTYAGSGTTMYSVGGNKVDYNDYQKATSQMQAAGQDAAELEQLLLQRLLVEQLLEEQYSQLGINITDKEITRIMNDRLPISQQLGQAAQQFGLPVTDRPTVLDAINNPSRYGISADQQEYLKNVWMSEEAELEQSLKQQIFIGMLSGLYTANELDARSLYDDNMTQRILTTVSVPTSSVPDDQVELSDADLKAKYDDLKALYKTSIFTTYNNPNYFNPRAMAMMPAAIDEPVRVIDYVVVPIQPSTADYQQADAEVQEALLALNEQNALEGLVGRKKFISNSNNVPLRVIKNDATLRELSDSDLVVGKVTQLRTDRINNTYNIVKVLGRSAEIDSINVSAYGAASQQEADSIMSVLNSGKSIADLLAATPDRGWDGQWLSLVGAQSNIKNRMETAATGAPFVYSDSVQGVYTIYQINQRKPAQPYAELALITYTVDPSAQTMNDLRTQLNSFLASNSKGDAFSANADSLYMLQHGFVSASSAHIGNLADTRKAVKWAMNAKAGDVSRVFETPQEYVVVAVKEVIDGDYIPATSATIKEQLRASALNDKKSAKLVEQYAGKATDIAGYAQAMGTEARTDSSAVFTSQRLAGHVGDIAKIQARMAAAKPGEVVGPFASGNEVVVLTVSEPTTEGRPYNYTMDGRTFMNTFGPNFDTQGRRAIDPVLFQMLVGDRDVKNRSLNFVGDIDD